jgi:hypothetical protein
MQRMMTAVAIALSVMLVLGSPIALAAATAPPGYAIASQMFTSVPGSFDSGGQTGCPTGTVIWGGGVKMGFDQSDTIETSAPNGTTGWQARVNDGGTLNQNFDIYALCAAKPTGYKIVFKTVDNLATTAHATAVCPTGTVVFGGGQLSTSDQTSVRMYNAWPVSQTKYRAWMFNGSGADAKLTVFAVCGQKPAGYTIVHHKFADPAGTTDIDGAVCPTNTSVIGGGINTVAIAGTVPLVAVTSSYPEGHTEWGTVTTNTNPNTVTVVSTAICAA